jgi:hypothetical protein
MSVVWDELVGMAMCIIRLEKIYDKQSAAWFNEMGQHSSDIIDRRKMMVG